MESSEDPSIFGFESSVSVIGAAFPDPDHPDRLGDKAFASLRIAGSWQPIFDYIKDKIS